VTRLIARPQRHGKTIEAIRLAAETGAYLIVVHAQEAMRVNELAKSMNLDIRYPVTFDEFDRTRMRGSMVRNVVIDNADEFLRRMFSGLTIDAATWTTVNPPPETET
jgi:hypothetical protein